jgi:hypothetical protein
LLPYPAFIDAFKVEGKLRKAAVTPETTYVSTGYVYLTYYMDATCSSASASEGYAVDTCFQENGASYKYQLTGSKRVLQLVLRI